MSTLSGARRPSSSNVASATLSQIRASTTGPSTQPDTEPDPRTVSRLVVGPTQRGILKDVLQPGIYYLNPRLVKVNVVPVGYGAITLDERTNQAGIRFYSYDGYQVEADFTVVWGRSPADAPNIVANIGNYDNPAFERLIALQAKDGSWPKSAQEPEGPYSTAMAVLTLSVPYRLLPAYQR